MSAAPVMPLMLQDAAAATVTMASPSWWGADSTRCRGLLLGRASLVKTYAPHARIYLDLARTIAAAEAAGDAGIAPAVLAVSPTGDAIAFADLTDSHATATLGDVADDDDAAALLALRARVGAVEPSSARAASVFDDIRALRTTLRRYEVALPAEAVLLFRVLDEAESRIDAVGVDVEFRHGDGNVSNVLRHRTDGSLLLVDWDWAGHMDPYQDLGSAIVELADDEDHARRLFEIAHGRHDRALFARSILYGYADLVRQALVGALANRLDPGTFEYSKYSDWQFLRARSALQTTRTDELLRRVSA
ncbi:phosphotransferase family protein [Microbacterium trichothecenolyticum]|uniref:Aminoglycoside phosphotransferase domain-containing protein n=1 Tax=Microbacterium trichothecenolyticum TaxID=69370 RepID=A0ABU0TWU2_MICTR|nr:phosphotransferase [Microbacterium trichothecenolyticum]MDQ1124134.1 hypothetical protein [Microbacterium trichothecenolyticum]